MNGSGKQTPLPASLVHRLCRRTVFCIRGFHSPTGLVLAALLLFACRLSAQEVLSVNGEDCGMHGNARNEDASALNVLKNRYRAPGASNFATAITLESLLQSGDPTRFSPQQAVVLTGYVYNVKVGGVETCNCRAKDPFYRDTHIELTPDRKKTAARYRLIVEVTPRMRMMMAKRGVDWSTDALRRTLKGHDVQVAGWLFYDGEHETGSVANDPRNTVGERNWRATCWEIHPVTYIRVIDAAQPVALSTLVAEQAGIRSGDQVPQSTETGSKVNRIWVAAVLLLLLFALFYLGRKRR